jgi:hypothetical protein
MINLLYLQMPAAAPLAPGFQALMAACSRLYPNQKNPLQVKDLRMSVNIFK